MIQFTATPIAGSKRGKKLGSPTINLDLAQVPEDVKEGIYVCIAQIDGEDMHAVMHYGTRPVFGDSKSCEVHVLDREIETPESVTVTVLDFLHPVMNFPSVDDLVAQIQQDIADARAILEKHDAQP